MNARVTLEPDKLEATIRKVAARIGERFPGSGLASQADALVKIADEACTRGERIRAPRWGLRAISGASLALLAAALIFVIHEAKPPTWPVAAVELAQGIDAALSTLILVGAAIAFVATLELRLKRKQALDALHELRVLAHVIDMHQLGKDPVQGPDQAELAFALNAYLNECSDLLALIGKVAAFYVQGFHDPVVLRTVNEIEDLTNGLSRKIWQKLTLLERITERGRG